MLNQVQGDSVIKGWTDGLSMLKKGAKANLYIPSALAYGARGSGADIKPNANLVFEIEVVDVVSADTGNSRRNAGANENAGSATEDDGLYAESKKRYW